MSKPKVTLELSRGYYHLFIEGFHNPEWCPECITIGTLAPKQPKSKKEVKQ